MAVSGSSRCQRTRSPISCDLARVEARSARRSRARSARPATQWSVSWPLPMSCSSAATISTSGRATRRISDDASMQVSTRCRSTVKRCTDRGVRQQPDPLPLRQDPVQRAGLVEGLPDAEQARARPRAAGRTGRAPRPATGRRSGGPSRASRAAVAGASTRSRSAASAAARSSSSGSCGRAARRGRGRPPRRRSRRPGRPVSSRGPARGRSGSGWRSTASTRRQASRERWVIRRRQSAGVPLGGGRRRAGRAARRSRPSTPGDPVGGPARPPSCSASRTSSSASRQRSRSACGTSTSQVATSALSTVASRRPPSDSLRSGTEACASSPVSRPRVADQLAQLGEPGAGVAPPLGEHGGAQPQRQVRVAGEVARVEHARSRPAGRPRPARAPPRPCAPSGRRWRPESQSGYQIWPAHSPTSTRRRAPAPRRGR